MIIENALNQNKMLKPASRPPSYGIADALLDSADFLAESLRWAARVLDGSDAGRPGRRSTGAPAWDAAVAQGRAFADARLHGARRPRTARWSCIELARTADFATGTAAEDEALADLIMSDELRSGLYAFDLVNKRAKRPAGAPDKSLARKVTKVGVVGAGLMAGQLALLFARRLEVPVVLTDVDQARLDKGVGYVHGEIDELLAKGRLNPDKANRLKALVTGSLTKDAFADADFVIEAVFEELSVKKAVFAELEQHVSAEAILATNTSSLSITEMAAELAHPERVVGFHFFNPVAVLPLLEIVRGAQDRRRGAGHRVRRRQDAEEVRGAGVGRPGVRGEPAADPVPRRGDRGGGRGHPDRGGRPGAGPARAADVAVRAAGPGRAGGGAARRRDHARRLPGPLPRVGEPAPAGRGGQARHLPVGHRQPAGRPRGGRAVRARRPAVAPRSRCATGRWPRWPRRSA